VPAQKKTGAAKKKPAKKKPAKKKPAKKKQKPAPKKKPAKKKKKTARDLGTGTKLPALSHHDVTLRQIDAVAHAGLRGDGEILGVAQSDVAPCRLVDHGGGRFSLCLDDFRMPQSDVLEARGLQGGGYTWQAVADALVRMRRPELTTDLTYDSEAGMFVALGGREPLRVLAKLIQEAINNPAVLSEAVNRADPDVLE
jgi:hypothetical protein